MEGKEENAGNLKSKGVNKENQRLGNLRESLKTKRK